MKNFDVEWDAETEEERTFQIRGEQFVLREAVRPEAMAEKLAELDRIRNDDDTTVADVMKAIDDFIILMIEPGDEAEARYRKVRELEDGGLSAARLQAIQKWILERTMGMVEEQTGFPTTPQPVSSGGRKTARRTSTGSSSSRDLQAV